MACNKVVYGQNDLIDLTSDTVVPDRLLKGYSAHDKSGQLIVGTLVLTTKTSTDQPLPSSSGISKIQIRNGENYEVLIDLTSDTVTANNLIKGYIAHDKSGNKIIGCVTGEADWFEFPFSNESLNESLLETGLIFK